LQHTGLFVIKKDERREEFNRDKLLAGIYKSCEKRPLPNGSIDKIADDIEVELYQMGKAEVSSSIIGDMVMARLKDLDYIAYIRFASVYREFTDITALKREVDTLLSAEDGLSMGQLTLLPNNAKNPSKSNRRRSK
jgi:transcriptional repressor NrdR